MGLWGVILILIHMVSKLAIETFNSVMFGVCWMWAIVCAVLLATGHLSTGQATVNIALMATAMIGIDSDV